MFKRFITQEDGAQVVEYALILDCPGAGASAIAAGKQFRQFHQPLLQMPHDRAMRLMPGPFSKKQN